MDETTQTQARPRWVTGIGAGLAVIAVAGASRPDGGWAVLIAVVAAVLLAFGIAQRN